MKKPSLCALGLVLATSLLPCQSQAAFIDLFPTFDQVYLHDHWPGGAWNRWDTNPNPNWAHYVYWNSGGANVSLYNTYLSFDLGTIPAAKVSSATLYLDLLSTSGDGAARVSISGLDNLLTHALGWTTVNVTSLLPVGGGNLDLATSINDPNYAGVDVTFGSPASGQSPYLRVELIPEPSSGWLLAAASMSLILAGRKPRRAVAV